MITRSRKTVSGRGKPRGGISRRVPNVRQLRKRILIVGEGRETETNYFHGLKNKDEVSTVFALIIKQGHGGSPEGVVRQAVEYKKREEHRDRERKRINAYDEVWCLLDVESPDNLESLTRAIALARDNGILICLSNPCFEVWFLLHFVKTGRHYNDSGAVVRDLSILWQRPFGNEYRKSDQRIYKSMSSRTLEAIQNAQWVLEKHHEGKENALDCNSSTDVYRLVKFLLGRD